MMPHRPSAKFPSSPPAVARLSASRSPPYALGPGPTLYTRYGDWFGWLTIVASIAVIAAMLL